MDSVQRIFRKLQWPELEHLHRNVLLLDVPGVDCLVQANLVVEISALLHRDRSPDRNRTRTQSSTCGQHGWAYTRDFSRLLATAAPVRIHAGNVHGAGMAEMRREHPDKFHPGHHLGN